MNEFLLEAMLAGVLLAAITGPLGSLVVWRHLAYFGDTIAHAALLGVAVSLISHVVPMTLAMFLVSLAVALLLSVLMRDGRFHADTMLGLLAHGTLAVGVLLVALSRDIQVDMNAYLFGDILSLNRSDLWMLGGLLVAVAVIIIGHWRSLILMTIDRNIARAEGVAVERIQLLILILLSATVALSIKIVGVLLITAMLIIPAAAARFIARSPHAMALYGSLLGAVSVIVGLCAALRIDAPAAPMMVAVNVAIFLILMFLSRLFQSFSKPRKSGL
jgi:zinc transport system permease protein